MPQATYRNLLERFPWIFQRAPPIVGESESIAYEGLILGFRYVDFVVVVRAQKVLGAITGLELLNALRETRISGFSYLTRTRMADICRPVGVEGLRGSLQSILDTMRQTRCGNVCIVQDGELTATVSLRDIVRYATSLTTQTNIEVFQLANTAVSMRSNATVAETLDLMISKRIRRILVQDSGLQKVVDDRVLVEYAFSHMRFTTLKDNPDDFWNLSLAGLPSLDIVSIDGKADVAEAWKAMYTSPAQCLLVDGRILTPWDVVIRLHAIHKFPIDDGLESIVARCFEATMRGLLGETASRAFLLKLENDFAFTPTEICYRTAEFSEILARILGPPSHVVERVFLRQLYAKVGISPIPDGNLNDALAYLATRLRAK